VTASKKLPKFATEDEDRDFWARHDATEYLDFSASNEVLFPNLKPTTRTISVRLPETLIDKLKMLANKRDVPYQSLMKVLLAEKVEEELHPLNP
jgi:predicted DNA binding CopG/RHH family protein